MMEPARGNVCPYPLSKMLVTTLNVATMSVIWQALFTYVATDWQTKATIAPTDQFWAQKSRSVANTEG